eukprot:46781-Pelagomonas_calceolata.AAC.1
MEPWSSARRATARRRSPEQILVAGVEIKIPSIGGSLWEALSLMHAAARQAWLAAQAGRVRECQMEDIGAGVVPEVGAVEKVARGGVSQLGSA